MKTQAWGWLTAAVLAAGLNSSYQNGGMQWAHEIVNRVQHNTGAVLALATGRADQFLAEARMVSVDRQKSKCPFEAAMAEARSSLDRSQSEFDQVQALSDREQAQLARLEARRARIEAQVQSKLARIQFADSGFTMTKGSFANNEFSFTSDGSAPLVVRVPRIQCPHLRVSPQRIPRVRVRIPRIDIPAPVVEVGNSGTGPI
jgi:multidrug efflux pump subunit AcrA (membrane-fusion protein)